MDELVFTPSSILDLLRQIDELKDYDISVDDVPGESIKIHIGESAYTIDTSAATPVEVEEDVVEEVADVNTDTYNELGDDIEVTALEDIESGILKELAKTLLVGGLVRLTNKLLKKDNKDKQ